MSAPETFSVSVTFPAGTEVERIRRMVGGEALARVEKCCFDWRTCDQRTEETVERRLAVDVTVDVLVTDSAIRAVAYRALVAKGGKGTAGGMTSKRRGPLRVEEKVVKTFRHVSGRGKVSE